MVIWTLLCKYILHTVFTRELPHDWTFEFVYMVKKKVSHLSFKLVNNDGTLLLLYTEVTSLVL